MGFGILGSLQVTAEGTSEPIVLPPKPRILMARLLLSANRTVPQLDERTHGAWTLRQVAFHVAESAFYADSVGMLAR
jgi:hypothetical protein